MAKESRQRLKQIFLFLFLGVSILLIAATWVEGFQELNVAGPDQRREGQAPTAVYDHDEMTTPKPSATHKPERSHPTPTPDAPSGTPKRNVSGEEM